ncbi:MAG TPA: DinB family protein [Streptosporangiaceae bacterium]|nr:DinB family protein [Streptosporangiaceae bacterium]
MTRSEPKATLQRYLQVGRDAMLWKLDGLGEYDIRRPLTPTGTNLLGLIKHLAGVEAGYFGEVFSRPLAEPMPWDDDEDADRTVDMWATANESRAAITGLYRRVWAHADQTIEALDLDAIGHVPWWGERGEVTLHQILVHVVAETHRHAGHADITRELIDGAVGMRSNSSNMPWTEAAKWTEHYGRVEEAARLASQTAG